MVASGRDPQGHAEPKPGVRFIGIAVLFRDIDRAQWRRIGRSDRRERAQPGSRSPSSGTQGRTGSRRMTWTNRVVWLEGMFLRAQHFQQQDRWLEALVRDRTGALASPCLGADRGGDRPQPAGHRPVCAGSGSGVFEDGTPFAMPGETDQPAAARSARNDAQCHRLSRAAGAPGRERSRSPPTAPPKAATSSATSRPTTPIPARRSRAEVQVGRLRLRYMLETENRAGYHCIGLARVTEVGADRRVALDDQWIAPCLACSAAPPLTGLLAEFAGLLNQRGEALAARLTAPGSRGVADVSDFLLLQSVNRSQKLLAHWASDGNVHPDDLYAALVQMAGDFATFTETSRRPSDYPPYRHADLQRSFAPVVADLRRSLSAVIEQTAIQIPLQERAYGVRVGPIVDRGILRSSSFVLAVQADVPTETAAAAVPVAGQDRRGRAYPRAGQRRLARHRGAAVAGRARGSCRSMPARPISSSTAIRRTGRNCSLPAASPSIVSGDFPNLQYRALGDPRLTPAACEASMSDNPFAEPDDDNRTVIRPSPAGAGRRQPQPAGALRRSEPPPHRGSPARRRAAAEGTEDMAIGGDVAGGRRRAAAPAHGPVAQYRATRRTPATLRERTVRQIAVFEQEARDKGVPLEQLRPAHYALCASLDDVVLNTPWGSSGTWSQRSLVSTFHQEVRSGERFFDLLQQMCAQPGQVPAGHRADVPLHVARASSASIACRAAASATSTGSAKKPTRVIVRQQEAGRARSRAAYEGRITPPTGRRASVVPLWVAAAPGWASSPRLFLWFSISLNAASDASIARLLRRPARRTCRRSPARRSSSRAPASHAAAAARTVDARQAAPVPQARDRPEASWRCSARRRSRSSASSAATCSPRAAPRVTPSFKPLLDRIGLALEGGERPGARSSAIPTTEPIRTIAFPSNFQLSTARAQAASTIIAADPRRAFADDRRGQGGCRSDRAQLHAGRPRTQPAHRNRPHIGRVASHESAAVPRLSLGAELRRRRHPGAAGLVLRSAAAGFSKAGCHAWSSCWCLLVGLGRRQTCCSTSIAAAASRSSRAASPRRPPTSADDRSGEEAAALRERMSTALSLLKRARGTRGYLYEQPWYVIIGPPGAGKTTALLNSGLKFPLAAEMGQGAVAGVGGTRLCDWWFTENAVLIDTAGRYTTQDSNAAVDRAGWDAFLDLLQQDAAAPAAERRDRGDCAQRHRQRAARRARGACARGSAAHQGARGTPGHSPAGLCCSSPRPT